MRLNKNLLYWESDLNYLSLTDDVNNPHIIKGKLVKGTDRYCLFLDNYKYIDYHVDMKGNVIFSIEKTCNCMFRYFKNTLSVDAEFIFL